MKRKINLPSKPSIKKLDDLAREIVRMRDKKCRRCGRFEGKLEVAHFYSRAIKTTRWNLDNLRLLCFNCHYQWAHRFPKEFADWWQTTLTPKEFEGLTFQAYQVCKIDRGLEWIYLTQAKDALNRKEMANKGIREGSNG